jgi:hypothetical protein
MYFITPKLYIFLDCGGEISMLKTLMIEDREFTSFPIRCNVGIEIQIFLKTPFSFWGPFFKISDISKDGKGFCTFVRQTFEKF